MNKPKFKVARRCKWKLPKAHSADEWLDLLRKRDAREHFVEGLTLVDGKLCIVKYQAGAVFALPLALWPHAVFAAGLGQVDLSRVDQWAADHKAGIFNEALALHARELRDIGF